MPRTFDTTEYKYLHIRRFSQQIRRSIEDSLGAWVIAQPNDANTWVHIHSSISNFLFALWTEGSLQGSRLEDAEFVHCGRDTMTADDLKQGRTNVEFGLALFKPAEFIMQRIAWQRP